MKPHLLSLILCALLIFSCTPTNKNIINGNITGLEKGDKIFLATGDLFSNDLTLVDSLVVETDGSFSIETSATGTGARLFIVKKDDILDLTKDHLRFFIEGFSTMNIDGNIDELDYAKTTGGLYAMEAMIEANKIMDSANVIQKIAIDKLDSLQILRKNNVSEDILKVRGDLAMKLITQSNNLFGEIDRLDSSFRENHPDMAYSASILRYGDVRDMGLDHFEDEYNKLTDRVKSLPAGKSLGEYISAIKATSIGAIAPDFKAVDISGNEISLSDFRGKYVLIEFWSTGCGFCIWIVPNLVNMYEKVKGDNFELLSIATGERSEEDLLKFIADKKMVWRHINDSKSSTAELIAPKYGIQGVPQCFFIDPEGVIIEKGHPLDLIEKVEKIIENNI